MEHVQNFILVFKIDLPHLECFHRLSVRGKSILKTRKKSLFTSIQLYMNLNLSGKIFNNFVRLLLHQRKIKPEISFIKDQHHIGFNNKYRKIWKNTVCSKKKRVRSFKQIIFEQTFSDLCDFSIVRKNFFPSFQIYKFYSERESKKMTMWNIIMETCN